MDSDKLLGVDSVIGFCSQLCFLPSCLPLLQGNKAFFTSFLSHFIVSFVIRSVIEWFYFSVLNCTIAIRLSSSRSRETDCTREGVSQKESVRCFSLIFENMRKWTMWQETFLSTNKLCLQALSEKLMSHEEENDAKWDRNVNHHRLSPIWLFLLWYNFDCILSMCFKKSPQTLFAWKSLQPWEWLYEVKIGTGALS